MGVLVMIPTLREAEALLGPLRAREALEGRGLLGGHPLSLVGMGPVEAAVGAGRAFARFPEVSGGILLGLGGSLDLSEAPLGALVGAEWFAMQPPPLGFLEKAARLGLEGELELRHPMPAGELPEGLRSEVDLCCSGGFVTVSEPREEGGREGLPMGALVEEMEGYGVARAAMAFGKGLVSLRAISNRAGDREIGGWDLKGAFEELRRVLRVLEAWEG